MRKISGCLFKKLCIVVFLPLCDQESRSHAQCQKLCHGDRNPDTVDVKNHWKQQYRRNLEQERTQEGDRCGDATIVERGKERGAKDVKSSDQVHECVDPESVFCHSKKICIISNKETGKRVCQKLRQYQKEDSPGTDQGQAFPEQILKFRMIACAVMVADDRCAADGVTEKDGKEYEIHVHDRTISCHTVLSGKFHKLYVVQ